MIKVQLDRFDQQWSKFWLYIWHFFIMALHVVLLLLQDGSKIFTASCDKSAKMWDLASNQFVQVAQVCNNIEQL